MTSLRYAAAVLFTLAVMLQGCGDYRAADKNDAELEQARKMVADLQGKLKQLQESLTRQKDQNDELIDRVQSLTDRMKEADKQREKELEIIKKVAEDRSQDVATGSRSEKLNEQRRVELMGAKALAEFRAKQLSAKADELKTDLDRKEGDLRRIRRAAEEKDAEVQLLTKKMEDLQTSEAKRTAELNSRLDKISKDLNEQSAQAKKFKQELDDKSELLTTLKNAVSDASKLKAAAEAEIARLQTELSETNKRLEASRGDAEEQRQALAQTRNQLVQAHQEIEQWRSGGEYAQREADTYREELEQYKQALAQTRQSGEEMRGQIDRSKQETEQLRAELETSREAIVQFRVETERAKQEVQSLKAQAADMTNKLQALQPKPPADDPTKLSTVDRILQGTVTEQEPESPSHLY